MVRAGGLIARGGGGVEGSPSGRSHMLGAISQKRQVRDKQTAAGDHTAPLSSESNPEPFLPVPPSTHPDFPPLLSQADAWEKGGGRFSGKGKVYLYSNWMIEK